MLCEVCGRNEATVHIMQVGPDGKFEKSLCAQCAMSLGEQLYEPLQKKDFSINEFLQGVLRGSQPKEQTQIGPVRICPNCGMRYEEFQKTGRIGCSECYQVFARQLKPIIRRVHGVNVHHGRMPRRSGGQMELQHEIVQLRAGLQQAIASEAYEKAAEYRDRIRELEQRLKEAQHDG